MAKDSIEEDHQFLSKIADFGMAKFMESEVYQEGLITENENGEKQKPYKWCSVEILKFNKYSKQSGKFLIKFLVYINYRCVGIWSYIMGIVFISSTTLYGNVKF